METTDIGAPVIEHSPDNPSPADVTRGANWFFWIAILSVIANVITYFGNTYFFFLSFALSELVNGAPMGWINVEVPRPFSPEMALGINIGIAAVFAGFGFFARKRSSWAFLIGFFIYMLDSIISIGYRDILGFAFHMLGIFFIFKGLVATRRLYQGV